MRGAELIRCKICGKKIETVDAENQLLVEDGVCLQCGIECSLDVSCEVCGKLTPIAEVTRFLGHSVCSRCTVEDLLRTVQVTCDICNRKILLLNACEYKGKHACRDCGISMMRDRNTVPDKKTTRFFKWFGL